MKPSFKITTIVASGLLSLVLVSCDKSSSNGASQSPDSQPLASQSDAAKPKPVESVNAKPAPQQDDEPITVATWKEKASTASEMDEIQVMKNVVVNGAKDPAGSVDFLVNSPHSPRRMAALRAVTAEWLTQDKQAVISKADSLDDEKLRAVMRMAIVHSSSTEQIEETRAWVNTWPETASERAVALEALTRKENPETPHVCGPECQDHVTEPSGQQEKN